MFLANLATLEQQHDTVIIIIRSVRWSGLKTIKLIKLPKNTAPSLHGFVELELFSLISPM